MIKKAADGVLLDITADGVSIDECAFDGSRELGFTGSAVRFTGSSNIRVENSAFRNAGNWGLYLVGVHGALIRNNEFSGNRRDQLFGEKGTTDVVVENNPLIDASQGAGPFFGHGIAFHATTTEIARITVRNNRILGGANFCIEAGVFGGLTATDITIDHNNCVAAADGYGGFSLDHVLNGAVTNNSYDSNTHDALIAGVEVVASSGAQVTSNTIIERGTAGAGVSVDRTSEAVVADNAIQTSNVSPGSSAIHLIVAARAIALQRVSRTAGIVKIETVEPSNVVPGEQIKLSGVPGFNGIKIVESVISPTAFSFHDQSPDAEILGSGQLSWPLVHDQVLRNRITLDTNSAGHPSRGIWLQCNSLDAECSDSVLDANVVDGNGAQQSIGIYLENDIGTVADNSVTRNQLSNHDTCIATLGARNTRVDGNVFSGCHTAVAAH